MRSSINEEPLDTKHRYDRTQKPYKLSFVVKLVACAAIGGFLFGYDTGIVAGAQLYFENDFPDITSIQKSLIISLASIGAAIGALFAGTISDKIGRKKIIVIADILFTLGALIQALAPTIPVLMIGRVIIGLGVGVASVIAPLYISEISPTELRGKLVAINIFTIVFGQLIAASIAFALGEKWRLMLGLAAIPSIIQFFGMFFMPESPRWLGKEEQWDKARGVLARIFQADTLEDKFEDLQQEVETLKIETAMSECQRLKDLLTVYKKSLIIGCGLQAWQQLVGINTAMYYGPTILIEAGIQIEGLTQNQSAILLNIPVSATNVIGTTFSIFMIEKYGRRYLILRGLPFCCLFLIFVSGGMWVKSAQPEDSQTGAWIVFAGILMYLIAFGIGMQSTPWAVNSEIYPLHVVGTGNSIATTSNWVSNFLVATLFPLALKTDLGSILIFLLLALFAVFAWIFTYCLLPETANKPIPQILREILGENYQKDKDLQVKVTETE